MSASRQLLQRQPELVLLCAMRGKRQRNDKKVKGDKGQGQQDNRGKKKAGSPNFQSVPPSSTDYVDTYPRGLVKEGHAQVRFT